MNNYKLEEIINTELKPFNFKDYCPNGLQIEGKKEIKKIICGVSASQALIDVAIKKQADAILVHHGYFWKGENQKITSIKYKRISSLIKNDINLYAYHLPLDFHPSLGNNVQLGKLLNLTDISPLNPNDPSNFIWKGKFIKPLKISEIENLITNKLNRKPLYLGNDKNEYISEIAWCTGGAQDLLEKAIEAGIKTFISGEVSERTTHIARENNAHYFCAGHHASERYGVQALGEFLEKNYALNIEFIEINNPI